MNTEIKAIIGLGNPGPQYRNNRHNIGFQVVDQLAQDAHARWQSKELFELAEAQINDRKIVLLKPQTFMNDSGRVMTYLQKQGIKPEQILVIHDELEKPFGSLAFKFGGSHRGHNGLRSIIGHIGADFWRLRFGIGRPEDKAHVSNYVLGNFTESQDKLIELIDQAITMIQKEL